MFLEVLQMVFEKIAGQKLIDLQNTEFHAPIRSAFFIA
jgi:hypothetical protein